MSVCADCGKTVERTLHGWRDEKGLMVCRLEQEPGAAGKLISADYHYVEGEEQRHYGTATR